MATQSVKIPVELQLSNIQGQIANLKKALSGVKEGTSAYKSLNTVLQQLERQFTAVQVESKKAFTSQSQINHFANGIEKLGNLAAVFQERMSEVDLKDFDIDLTAFSAAEKKVKDLTAELEHLKSGKLGQDVFEDFGLEELSKKLKIDITKDSLFSDVILELDKAYIAIDENIDKMYKQADRAKDARQQFAKGLGKSVGKGDFSKDIEALAKANSTSSITAASRDSVTTDLLASLGLNLKGVKSSGNTAAEYISSVTQSISAKIKEHNTKIQTEIDSLTKTKSNLEDALDLVSDLKSGGAKTLSQEDKDNIFNLTGINVTQKSIESAQNHLNDLIRKNLAATQKQEGSLIKIDNATIQQAATNAAKQLQVDSKLQAKAFVLEVTKLLQAGGMQQNAKDLEMLPGEQLPDYISRLTEMVRQRGIELREEYSGIVTDIKTQEQLLTDTGEIHTKLGDANTDRQMIQIPMVQEDLNKAKEGLEQAGQAAKDSVTSIKQVGDTCQEVGKNVDAAGDKAQGAAQQLEQMSDSARRLANVQNAIKQWFGFNEVINLTKRAISDAINHIRELDKVMTEIAVVTDMTQKELWDQISTYSDMAQKYGATTEGVYEVSQLYYQQGLQTAEVMQLTEETLKMAKIAGLDYADATDYMTVAIRGFKLEMSDAQNIVDVYSNIAAVTASDTEELAIAMSKTASSAEAVGSSFENTTAMIALMVETTREAPENIGSAMKSIISRYGEMTTNPAKLIDSEGEAMSLNKVDKALSSVGISLRDVNGQFRDFDEVILELSSKWDTIDKNTQRYIATVMAGNRQQSRFLALVGNYDRLSELYEEAANSQDAATLQTLKTMDSIETKINQLKTAFQEFYTNTGIEDMIKGILDYATSIINTFNDMPKLFGKIPVIALSIVSRLIIVGKQLALKFITAIEKEVSRIGEIIAKAIKQGQSKVDAAATQVGKSAGNKITTAMDQTTQNVTTNVKGKASTWATVFSSLGTVISAVGLSIDETNEKAKGTTTIIGSLLSNVGGGAATGASIGGPWGALIGGIIGLVASIPDIIAGVGMMVEDTEEKIERLTETLNDAKEETLISKNELKTLSDYKKALEKATAEQYDSAEAKQVYLDLNNEIAEKYPQLISYIDSEGNYIVSLTNAYDDLLNIKRQAYETDLIEEGAAALEAYSDRDFLAGATDLVYLGTELNGSGWTDEGELLYLWNEYLTQSGQLTLGEISPEQLQTYAIEALESSYRAVFQNAHDTLGFNDEFFRDLGLDMSGIYTQKFFAKEFNRELGIEEVVEKVTEPFEYANDFYKYFSGLGLFSEEFLSTEQFRMDSDFAQTHSDENGLMTFRQLFETETLWDDKAFGLNGKEIYSSGVNTAIGDHVWQAMLASILEGTNYIDGQLTFAIEEITGIQGEEDQIELILGDTISLTTEVDEAVVNYILRVNSYLEQQNDYFNNIVDGYVYKLFESKMEGSGLDVSSLTSTIMSKDFNAAFLSYFEEAQTRGLSFSEAWTEWSEEQSSLDFMDSAQLASDASQTIAALDDYYENIGNYTHNQVQEALANVDPNTEIGQYITESFQEIQEAYLLIAEAAAIKASTIGEDYEGEVKNLFLELPYQLYNAVHAQISAYSNLIANATTSSDKELAERAFDEFLGVFSFLDANSLGLSSQQIAQAKNIIASGDVFSLNGLFAIKDSLAELGINDTSFIDNIIDNTVVNLNTEWETLATNASAALEGLSEALSNAADGMSFEDAVAMANKLGANLTEDFEFKDGEYFYRNAAAIVEAYNGYNEELREELNQRTSDEIAKLRGFKLGSLREGNTEAADNYQAQIDALQESQALVDEELEKYTNYLTNIALLNAGFYDEFVNQINEQDTEKLEAATSSGMLGAARQGEQALRKYFSDRGIEVQESYIEAIMNNIDSLNSDIVSMVLDAVENGSNSIDIAHLTEGTDLSELTSINISDAGVAQAFAQIFGSNKRAYNEAMVSYMEATQKDYQSVFESILSDPKDIDLSTIEEFANLINLTISEVFAEGYFVEDSFGNYHANIEMIQGVIGSNVQYGEQLINDHFQEYLDEILGFISGGISGKLTNVEFAKLGEYINSITDENISLQVTKTAEGLKLTEGSLLKVYSTLQGVNSLAAKVVLDELVEDAMDSDESLNNIYNVMNKIADINKKIAQAGAGTEREKALRAELAVAKEIRDTLMEAGDAFNFMDQDLPTSLSNPLSMREGVSDALSILDGDDFKAGYIDYTDLYNMLNMMEQAGVDLRSTGLGLVKDATEFDSSAALFTALMQEAAGALTTVDGKTVVDLSQFGDNFTLGAEGMRTGIAEGIQVIAESQIDMIDAEIALLETIVQSQQAFESLDLDENGVIDVSEIEFFGENPEQWTAEQIQVAETIEGYIGDYMLSTGHTIAEVIGNPEYWAELTEADKTLIANLTQAFSEVFSGDDWEALLDGSNAELIEDRINAILADYGYQINIDRTKLYENIDFGDNGASFQELRDVFGPEIWNTFRELGLDTTIQEAVNKSLAEGTPISLVDILQFDFISEDLRKEILTKLGLSISSIGELTPEQLLVLNVTTTVDGKFKDKNGTEFDTAEEAIQSNANLLSAEQYNEMIAAGAVVVVVETTGKVKYNDVEYDNMGAAYAAWQADNEPENPTETYEATADIQITPANITIQTEGETGELIAEDLAVVKATATELIITPAEGGVKLAEETTPTIETMNAVITAFTVNPTATSLAEDASIDIDTGEGTTTITVDKATIAALSADGVISEDATGGFKLNGTLAELEAKIAELETPANLVKNGDVYTLSGTTIQLSADVVSKLAEEGGILTPTEEGYTLNGTTVAEAELTVAQLASDGLLSSTNGVYTFTGDVKDIDLGINGDTAAATNAIQSIIDAYDNADVTLNVNIQFNQGNSLLADQYLTGDTSSLNASPTPYAIQQLAQGNNLYGFGAGNIQNSSGISAYLQALKTDLSQITPADLQILEDLNTIVSNFEMSGPFAKTGEEYFSWAEDLATINALMEENPLFTDTGDDSSTLTSTLTTLSNLPLETIVQAITDITTNSTSLSTLSFENINNFITTLQAATGEDSVAQTGLTAIKQTLEELTAEQYKIDLLYNITSTADQEGTYSVNVEDNGTAETLTNLSTALLNLNTQANALMQSANAITSTGPDNVKALKEQMNILPDKSTEVGNTADAIGKLKDKSVAVGNTAAAINKLKSKSITASITVRITAPNPTPGSKTSSVVRLTSKAKGNVALAKGTGKAAAKGKTLMGELGPELVVSDGRYYVVGQNGAEFVDLADDAIVFNHLQTKKLLGAGGSVGTGEPVTNERNAVALASGNATGPAIASASEALAELYKLRAMWQGLLDASANELGKKAGGLGSGKGPGGGGGGSGGGSGEDSGAVLADIERWYNLLREIAKLEQQITMEQAKRENMRNGYDYSASLQKELKLLEKQRAANAKLAEEQKKYYEQRRADLNATDYSKIFTYDEDGLMQYVEEDGLGLDILAHLNATDENGKAIYDAKDQLKELQKTFGFDISVLKTNADGTKAEDEEQMMQNFWDGIDGWMEEMDSLYDSYNDAAIATEEATAKMNEILQEYIDNQLDVEQKLLKAIEDREQAEIDRIQEEKDLLEEAAQEYIDGLSEALDKERSMYEKNETDAETARLQRQLAILQRSGGSASEIKSLQDQIDSRLQDAYFQEQQDQIDAIQEASNNQIEKLQTQIDIMTETLEYQKENGLLWNEVFEMMQTWTPEAMLQFIQEFTQEQQENSPTQNEQDNQETLGQLQMYTVDRDWKEYYDGLDYSDEIKEEHKAGAYEAFAEAYATGGEAAAITAANEYYKQATTTPPETPPANGGGGGGDSTPPDDNKKKIQFNRGTEQYWTYKNSKREGKGQIFYGNKKSPVVEVVDETDNMYQISGKDGKGTTFTNRWISKKTSKGKNIWKAYKTGGLVDYTGPAWVDGSKRKPEAFLSAEDTAMLKSKIFSNSDGSLKALVSALEEITSNTSHYSNSNAISEQIVIQNAQVNIQPGTISNDYDARRAGEMALEEMVKIARKTTNRVVSR